MTDVVKKDDPAAVKKDEPAKDQTKFDFTVLRNPANANLRAAVSVAKEDMATHLMAISSNNKELGLTPTSVDSLVNLFGPFLANLLSGALDKIFHRDPASTTPVPSTPPPTPPPTPMLTEDEINL